MNIYRVGQISGDTENGVWNTTEMAAMMIYAGAGQLKKMPNVEQTIQWIPVDVCSASLVALALKSLPTNFSRDECVYHLVNPHSITYEQYLQSLRSAGLHFNVVSPSEFLQAIATSSDSNNPLIKLFSFLEKVFCERGRTKLLTYETLKTTMKCEILRSCPPIDAKLIQLYLNYWKKCHVL